MSYKQLVKANVGISEQVGWCLSYARRVFGRPAVEPTAWDGWQRCKYKHKNRSFPKGVSFPVWFDHWGDYGSGWARYGHVAVVHTDGRVYSSPLNGYGRAVFGSVDELVATFRAYGLNMTYVGWSEDISGARVIRKGDDMITQNQLNVLWRFYFGKAPTSADSKTYVGKKTFAQTHDIILKGQGLKNRVNNARAGKLVATNHLPAVVRKVYVDPNAVALKKALASLAAAEKSQALNDSLTKQVVEARKETETALKRIAKLEAEKQEATATGNAFMRWIGEVLNTILRKG